MQPQWLKRVLVAVSRAYALGRFMSEVVEFAEDKDSIVLDVDPSDSRTVSLVCRCSVFTGASCLRFCSTVCDTTPTGKYFSPLCLPHLAG